MTERQFNDSPPSFLSEGLVMDHDANLISTWHLDFRPPAERSPIGQLVKYSRAEHAVERCKTIQLARPPYFRRQGETLIHDENEAQATKVLRREGVPLAVAQAWKQQAREAGADHHVLRRSWPRVLRYSLSGRGRPRVRAVILVDWFLFHVWCQLSEAILGLMFIAAMGTLLVVVQAALWVYRKVRDAWNG